MLCGDQADPAQFFPTNHGGDGAAVAVGGHAARGKRGAVGKRPANNRNLFVKACLSFGPEFSVSEKTIHLADAPASAPPLGPGTWAPCRKWFNMGRGEGRGRRAGSGKYDARGARGGT